MHELPSGSVSVRMAAPVRDRLLSAAGLRIGARVVLRLVDMGDGSYDLTVRELC